MLLTYYYNTSVPKMQRKTRKNVKQGERQCQDTIPVISAHVPAALGERQESEAIAECRQSPT